MSLVKQDSHILISLLESYKHFGFIYCTIYIAIVLHFWF